MHVVKDIDQYPVTKLVSGDWELDQWTRQGWRLLAILPETRNEVLNVTEVVPASQPGYSPMTMSAQKLGNLVSTHRFLIGLDEKSALAEAQEGLNRLYKDWEERSGACRVAAHLFKNHQSEVDNLRYELREVTAKLTDATKRAEAMSKTASERLADLNRIKESIGSARYDAVLNPSAADVPQSGVPGRDLDLDKE